LRAAVALGLKARTRARARVLRGTGWPPLKVGSRSPGWSAAAVCAAARSKTASRPPARVQPWGQALAQALDRRARGRARRLAARIARNQVPLSPWLTPAAALRALWGFIRFPCSGEFATAA